MREMNHGVHDFDWECPRGANLVQKFKIVNFDRNSIPRPI